MSSDQGRTSHTLVVTGKTDRFWGGLASHLARLPKGRPLGFFDAAGMSVARLAKEFISQCLEGYDPVWLYSELQGVVAHANERFDLFFRKANIEHFHTVLLVRRGLIAPSP